jgi:hypothetical protein
MFQLSKEERTHSARVPSVEEDPDRTLTSAAGALGIYTLSVRVVGCVATDHDGDDRNARILR